MQLDPVLHRPQEPVGGVQRGGVGPADVAAGRQLGQRLQGVRAAQRGVGAAVHQLEQLDGELHVAQPAGAELELAVQFGGRDRLDHPPAHLLHVRDEVLPLGRLPDQRRHRLGVGRAEFGVAGHRAGLEQRLELPGLGPALVVRQVAGQGAHQRPVAALGAQVGVHRPDGALAGGVRAEPHHVRGQPGGRLQRLLLRHALAGLRDEDHVHVGDVVELAAAALAHRDHGEPAGLGGPRVLLGGDRQRALQGGAGQVGEFGGGLGQVGGGAQVAGGDGQQAAAVGGAQRVGGLAGRGGDPLVEPAAELGGPRVHVAQFEGDQRVPVARVGGQVVAEGGGGAEDAQQPVAQRLGGGQGVAQGVPLGLVQGLQQPGQAQQREVGVGGGAERVQQYRVVGQPVQGGCGQSAHGRLGVGEAPADQPDLRPADAAAGGRHPVSLSVG